MDCIVKMFFYKKELTGMNTDPNLFITEATFAQQALLNGGGKCDDADMLDSQAISNTHEGY